MASAYPDPGLLPSERPRCPNCQVRMVLLGIQKAPKRMEIRSFECSKCGLASSIAADADPMFSEKSRWIEGELRPPE